MEGGRWLAIAYWLMVEVELVCCGIRTGYFPHSSRVGYQGKRSVRFLCLRAG